MCERSNSVLNPLINFEPMKILENWRYVVKFRSFGDSMYSSIDTAYLAQKN